MNFFSGFDSSDHAVTAYIHAGDNTDHAYHEQNDYQILVPVGSELFRDSLYKWISHQYASLPFELGSGDLLIVDIVMAYDTVS